MEGFGSFLMDMFNAKSDLDLSINFSDKKVEARRDAKIKALRKFANKFYVLQSKLIFSMSLWFNNFLIFVPLWLQTMFSLLLGLREL